MRSVSLRLTDLCRVTIPIGHVGDNLHTQVRIDCLKLFEEYPDAIATLTARPPKGDPYPTVAARDGDFVVWDVSDSDLVYPGTGEIQVKFTVDSVVVYSAIAKTRIDRSILPTGSIPDPVDDWLQEAEAALAEIPHTISASVDAAMDTITAEAETLQAGSSATASYDPETKKFTFGVPAGADGRDGVDGKDGADGKDGKDGQDGHDGADGKDGKDGKDGQDGAPGVGVPAGGTQGQVLAKKTGTDYDTEWVDQSGGDPTAIIDDTAGSGDTNKVWSADKSSDLLNEITSVEESIAPVESSATATSAHAVGELFVLNNQLLVALSAIAVGDTITTTGESPNAAVTTLSAKMLKDVQVNGTSVVTNGVANIPKAGSGTLGVIKTEVSYGTNVRSDGTLNVSTASANEIKLGASSYKPVPASDAGTAAFYGLSKVAGVDLKNVSDVTVGTYPENSKSAISQMLNAPESVSGSTPSITAKAGVRYICGECSTLSITAPASGCIDVVFESGSTPTVLTVTSAKTGVSAIKWANGFDPTSLDADTTYEINILDGEFGVVGSWT